MTPLRSSPETVSSIVPEVPEPWRQDLAGVLISAEGIERRIDALAGDLMAVYSGRPVLILALLNGTVVFLADLIRKLSIPMTLDFIRVSSYGSDTSPKELTFAHELDFEIQGRDVLLVDDILDTGRTLSQVEERIRAGRPKSIASCVLLDKPSRRECDVRADFAGFEIPNEFVVGYGMDYAERFRNLPFIGVLKPEVIGTASESNPKPKTLTPKL